MKPMFHPDTIAAIATPAGRGGVGIIRLSGPDALALALRRLGQKGLLRESPLRQAVAAVSVGICDGQPYLDLPYEEDSRAEVDMNVVMAQSAEQSPPSFVEVQGTGEHGTFSRQQLDALLGLAEGGIGQLLALQQVALAAAR